MSDDLPRVTDELAWVSEALTQGFKPGHPVDDALLDRLVDHLNSLKRLAALWEAELTVTRQLLEEAEKRRHVSAASIHPQPEKMQ